MKLNRFIVLFLMIASVAFTVFGATNYIHEADVVPLTWSSLSPATTGQPCIKCSTKAAGGIIGVNLNGTGTEGETVSVRTQGIFDLPVTASSSVGNIAVGDFIYAAVDGVNSYSTTLSNINTGLLFGTALEAITATTTTGVYTTINVMLRQPGHL